MILGRLREHQDKSSLAGALVKGGFAVVKAGKLLLALASFAAYTFLFSWQFAVIILGMLVIHEGGHLRCMKHCPGCFRQLRGTRDTAVAVHAGDGPPAGSCGGDARPAGLTSGCRVWARLARLLRVVAG
jgi:hypothetical protein